MLNIHNDVRVWKVKFTSLFSLVEVHFRAKLYGLWWPPLNNVMVFINIIIAIIIYINAIINFIIIIIIAVVIIAAFVVYMIIISDVDCLYYC